MSSPAQFGGREHSAEDLAITWGIPTEAVRSWIANDTLTKDANGRIGRSQVLAFLNSEDGQAALQAARSPQ